MYIRVVNAGVLNTCVLATLYFVPLYTETYDILFLTSAKCVSLPCYPRYIPMRRSYGLYISGYNRDSHVGRRVCI